MAKRVPSLLAWCTAVLVADQLTKATATAIGSGVSPLIEPVRNDALSLQVADGDRWLEVALMAVGLAVAALPARRWVAHGHVPAWAAALMLGGAGANLADRAVLGAVRDFLVVGPVVINAADVAVVAGLAAVLAGHRQARSRSPGRSLSRREVAEPANLASPRCFTARLRWPAGR